MTKVLYSIISEQVLPYPRLDDEPVIGLDAEFLVLDKVDTVKPNNEFQYNSRYVIDLELFEYRLEWELIEPVEELPQPNWDNFNLSMMSNLRFNQVYNQCLSVAPLLAGALPTALDQVTSKGTTLFHLVFNQICSIGGATVEDRLVWGTIAEDNNLPIEFVNILKG